ncbi:MAG: hypothetical protein IJI96_02610 [Methanobrevibacter sp.]|nr:hypothetical protein [Methanobrevibacter sp.]MBQ6627398.1 hypothetical protein [Methanobrevibacter sp.]
MNRKGEFTKDERISARVHPSTKRLIKKLNHTEAEVVEYAAKQLANEPILLEWEIGEIEIKLAQLQSELYELEALKQAKLNRLKLISPERLDDETLANMLVDSAKECALDIFNNREDCTMDIFDNHAACNGVRAVGKEWGYDPNKFLCEVKNQLRILCQTDVSDI